MYSHDYHIRVRYGDTDQMGFVYYGNYAYYYEQARAEAIRAGGITYKEIEESGIMMPIVRMSTKYIAPAYYDELLTVKTTIPFMPGRIITFRYEIRNEKGELINEGETELIFMDAQTRRIKSAPDAIVKVLKPYFS